MMQAEFDYKNYIEAMKTLSGMKAEMDSDLQRLAAEQMNDQKRIQNRQQDTITHLEHIKEGAIIQFDAVRLRYREVCNLPAEAAERIANSSSVDETLRNQTAAVEKLQKAIDSVIEAKKEARRAEARRLENEIRRRQELLDQELASAGYKPSGKNSDTDQKKWQYRK